MRHLIAATTVTAITLCAPLALAATYQVGPSRTIKTLTAVAGMLNPGDIVEVDGDATYAAVNFSRNGSAAAPITIRGLRVAGKRPVISGGTNSVELSGDYYTLEGLDITGGSSRCVFHHSHGNVIRDSVVHDCPKQGILGADQDSGSLTLEYSEVYNAGGGTFDHQIYMATDEVTHPGAVFRMQYCYVHDANGGNDVKSRAERNEIYYNWIEGGFYHELELIGPDPAGAKSGWTEALKREDSDVVGNVFKRTRDFHFVRIGGDDTGQSLGRYRFKNNTFITPFGNNVFRLFDKLDSVEMHNNVIYGTGATAPRIIRMDPTEMSWVSGESISGINNWVSTGSTLVPTAWTGTITGTNPMLVSVAGNDLTPAAGSPLIDKGAATTAGPAGKAFPSPLVTPAFHPPMRALIAVGSAAARPTTGVIDIGAFERGTVVVMDAGADTAIPADTMTPADTTMPADTKPADTMMAADTVVTSDTTVTDGAVIDTAVDDTATMVDDTGTALIDSSTASDGANTDAEDAALNTDAPTTDEGSCGCRTAGRPSHGWLALALLGLMVRRRRRSSPTRCRRSSRRCPPRRSS